MHTLQKLDTVLFSLAPLAPAALSLLAAAFAFLGTASTILLLRCFVGPLTPEFLAVLVNVSLHTTKYDSGFVIYLSNPL